MGVQQGGNRGGIGQDAGHVRGGREAADQQRPLRVPGQVSQVDVAVGVLADDHHLGDGLTPRQLVGVMLVRADEYHRPLGLRDAVGEPVPLVQPGRDAQLQDADELVHRGGRPGSAEDDQVISGAADRVTDDPPGVLAQPGGRQAGAGAFGMGVSVSRGIWAMTGTSETRLSQPARGVTGDRVGPGAGTNGPGSRTFGLLETRLLPDKRKMYLGAWRRALLHDREEAL